MRDHHVGAVPTGARPTGRLGSWHSYRWQWWVAGAVMALAVPWPHVPPDQRPGMITGIVVLNLVWAIPAWRCGLTVDQRGVRCTGVVRSRRYRWDRVVDADVEWHEYEPRLLLRLDDGDEVVVPGLRMPQHQAYRRDLWRDSRMYAAAELIHLEAERRLDPAVRHPPRSGRSERPRASRPRSPARR